MGLFFGLSSIDAYTMVLMHMDGTDGSTTFVDETGLTVSRSGNPLIDTAESVFGGASADFSGGGYLTVPGANFGLGTGNFVLEVRARMASFPTWSCFINLRTGAGNGIWFGCSSTTPVMHQSGGNRIVGNALSTGTWYHIALIRSSSVSRLFVNGVQVGSDYADTNNYTVPTTADFGADNGGTNQFNGWLDEVRISKGTDRGWFGGFTPSGPY